MAEVAIAPGDDGEVSDFPWADFGVVPVRECP
jgi:hypothetical protein